MMTPDQVAALVLTKCPYDWRAIGSVAVILQESGGDEWAVNKITNPLRADGTPNPAYRSLDLGLLQLNTFYHPVGVSNALDPVWAWNYAWKIVGPTPTRWSLDWTKWVAYTSGAYKKHLTTALRAVNAWGAARGLPPLG